MDVANLTIGVQVELLIELLIGFGLEEEEERPL